MNVVYTIAGEPFRLWVEQVMEDRNAKIKEDKDLGIDLDPEILRIFRASTSVSSKYTFLKFSPIFDQRPPAEPAT